MNAKKISSTLKSLQAKKAAIEAKRAEMIKQYDEEIASLGKEIQAYTKILARFEQLQKEADEQLALAESLMRDKKEAKESSVSSEENLM